MAVDKYSPYPIMLSYSSSKLAVGSFLQICASMSNTKIQSVSVSTDNSFAMF